ncbi:MAG: hypothetical protein IT454_14005 [Planctomycetes bacterium]|nr:hypothetical protein [Planctomycetota bacterium]
MKALNVLLAIVVSVVMALLMFEGGLRLIGKGPPASLLEFDNHLGWRKRPNASVHRSGPEYSVTITTNEWSLADDPLQSAAKPAGVYRVVVLGDSFTQGFTVSREHLYVDLLERRWKAEGRNVDVINAGTEGWSTDQEVVWFLRNGAQFQPDLVVLQTYDNDLYWNGQGAYIDRGSEKPLFRADGTLEKESLTDVGPRPWSDSLAVVRLVRPFVSNRFAAAHVFEPVGGARPILKEFAALLPRPPEFFARSLEGTRGALTALQRECAKLGARLVVVPIPSHGAVDPAFGAKFAGEQLGLAASSLAFERPVETVLAMANEASIQSFDLRPALAAAHGPEHELYFNVDWHLNPNGNRVLASALHDELDRAGWLPAASTAVAADTLENTAARPAARWPLVFGALWVVLSALFLGTYPDERNWKAPLKVGAMLAAIFTIVLGGGALVKLLPQAYSGWIFGLFVVGVLGFVAFKLGRRFGTILELLRSFVLRGHWYLMPLLVVLLTIGSLLVVAASSPLIAPFIYTLF